MKRIPWISIASLTAVMLLGASIATLSPSPARADALTCVDDPPPDPTECPFCGETPSSIACGSARSCASPPRSSRAPCPERAPHRAPHAARPARGGCVSAREMAGAHGNRTHRPRCSRSPTGFEDRAAHQHRSAPARGAHSSRPSPGAQPRRRGNRARNRAGGRRVSGCSGAARSDAGSRRGPPSRPRCRPFHSSSRTSAPGCRRSNR